MRITRLLPCLVPCLLLPLGACSDKTIPVGDDTSLQDADADGYLASVDCDEGDAAVHPGADDPAGDGVDADCDGADGSDTGGGNGGDTGPQDADGDGSLSTVDCDDTDGSIHPGATDTPGDGIDQDCNGSDATPSADADADGDGYASEAYAGPDCDDANSAIHPGATETAHDGLDSDCDGADFSATAFVLGDIVLTEVMYDPDAVSDSNGEWFEVINATDATVNLLGLVVSDDTAFGAKDIFTVDADVVVEPGARAVLGVDGAEAANGGVHVDFDYPGAGVNFNNGADDLYLGIPGGRGYTTLDSLAYDEKRGWPLAKGFSIELNDSKVSATENDAASAWCLATSAAGTTTDKGSPGKASSGC